MAELQEFDLKKHRPGCTGMFWRSDPTGATKLASNNNWPRDGAKLRGKVITNGSSGEKWLLATHVKQQGDKEWKPAPVGAAMPFEYNNHYSLAYTPNI
ncbi:MAG: hypothetical protein SGILL_005794 [Bacillariaceae sp.]